MASIAQNASLKALLYNLAAEVLDVSLEELDPTKSFLALGGDSLSAIEYMGKCRQNEVWIEISDMMDGENLSEVIDRIIQSQPTQMAGVNSKVKDTAIQPSRTSSGKITVKGQRPIQSIQLSFKKDCTSTSFERAITGVVQKHTVWQSHAERLSQFSPRRLRIDVTDDPPVSKWIFAEVHMGSDEREAVGTIERVRLSLETEQEAVFGAVHCYCSPGAGGQTLVLMSSIIDQTSWRILINELSNTLGDLIVEPLPIAAQPDASSRCEGGRNATVKLGDSSFAETILCGPIHTKLRTKASDVINAALIAAAFELGLSKNGQTDVHHILNKRHDHKKSWDTVGNFDETIYFQLNSIYTGEGALATPINVLRQCKDAARAMMRGIRGTSGVTSQPTQMKGNQSSLCIGVCSADSIQAMSHTTCSVKEPFPWTRQNERLLSFESIDTKAESVILAFMFASDGNLKLTVSDSEVFSQHHTNAEVFAHTTKRILLELISELDEASVLCTRSDFPLPEAAYPIFDSLITKLQHSIPNALEAIENIGPCTPMQDNFLISQKLASEAYQCRFVLQIASTKSRAVDVATIRTLWIHVVNRHSILRTSFVESDVRLGKFDQVVWKHIEPWISVYQDLKPIVEETQVPKYAPFQPPQRFSIASDAETGAVFVKLDISHALIDGQSTEVLMRDICHSFNGTLPQTPALPYLDFTENELQIDSEPTSTYWARYMNTAQATYLPVRTTNHPGELGTVQTSLKFSAGYIGSFCGQNRVTPANICQVAWGLVLKSFLGSNNVCFAFVTSRRQTSLPGIQEAVGPFLDVLFCRLSLENGTEMKQLLAHTSEHFIESLPYQNITTALARSQEGQGPSVRQWGNTILSFHRSLPAREYAKYGLEFKLVDRSTPTDFDVSLNIDIDEDQLKISLDFWDGKMDYSFVTSLLDVFQEAIRFVLVSSQLPVGAFSPLTQGYKQLLCESLDVDLPKEDVCVHDMVHSMALRQPQQLAVSAWDGDWTYKELTHEATSLAQMLVSKEGIKPATRVALCMEKSRWALAAMMAILNCGATIVLVGIDDPRAADLISKAGVGLILADATTLPRLQGVNTHIRLVGDGSDSGRVDNGVEMPFINPNSLAWILYTSGSSGQPKGVMLEHSAIGTALIAHGRAFQIDSSTRAFQFAAYTFADSVTDIFATLIRGGCVCVPSEQQRVSDLAGAMRKLKVNQATLTNTVAGLLLDPNETPKLRRLVLSGEMPSAAVVKKWASHTQVINGYGQSEAGIFASCSEPITDPSQAATIGRPITGRFWIVQPDDASRLCPPGAPGELVIESQTLARGYLNEPKHSAAAFVETPGHFKELGGALKVGQAAQRRCYRTGDIVRQSAPNDPYVFIGRLDTQVKIRGQRVELGEIEATIAPLLPEDKFTTVSASIVDLGNQGKSKLVAALELAPDLIGYQFASNDQHVVIHIDSLPGIRSVLETLQYQLLQKLPIHMVPSLFIPLNRLPVNASKKIDRLRLRRILETLSAESIKGIMLVDAAEPARHPRTKLEHQLRDLWGLAFGIVPDSISVRDNFFQAGGDSVTAARMSAAARTVGISLTVAQVFKHTSIQDLASALSANLSGIDATTIPFTSEDTDPHPFALWKDINEDALSSIAAQCHADERKIQDIYPATPLQEGLLAITMKRSKPDAYVLRRTYRVSRSVSVSELRVAWEALVACTPILRTRIALSQDGTTVQVVLEEEVIWEGDADTSLSAYLQHSSGFLVEYGQPLSRVALVKGDESDKDQWYFVWTIHHSLFDGWSTAKILNLLDCLWKQQPLPSKPIPMSRFVRYLVQQENGDAQSFWSEHLSGVTKTTFPALPDVSYEPLPKQRLERKIELTLDRKSNVTIATLLRATWAILLASHSGEDEAVMMLTLSGRNAPVPGITDLLAPTLTSVPFRVLVRSDQTVQDFLIEVQRRTTEMIPFEHTGLQYIRRSVPSIGARFDPGHVLTIQTTSAVSQSKNTAATYNSKPSLAQILERLGTDQDVLQGYALTIDCVVDQSASAVTVEARFDDNVLPGAQVKAMLAQFSSVYSQIQICSDATKSSRLRIGDLDLMGGVHMASIQALRQRHRIQNAGAADKIAGIDPMSLRTEPYDDDRYHSPSSSHGERATVVETLFQRAWSNALEIPVSDVKLRRSFLSFGGDSVAAIKVIALCRAEGLHVSLRDILECQSIKDLVRRIGFETMDVAKETPSPSSQVSQMRITSGSPALARTMVTLTSQDLDTLAGSRYGIKATDIEQVLTCSPFQQGILFQQFRSPESYSIRQIFCLRSKDPTQHVDVGHLIGAWQQLQAYHSIMRTVFIDSLPDQDELLQVVLRSPEADMVIKTCSSNLDPIQYLESLPSFQEVPGRPPHRFTIVSTQDGSVYCRIETTHALVDAVSFEILTSELLDNYEKRGDLSSLNSSPQPSLRSNFGQYIDLIRQRQSEHDLKYWTSLLVDVPACTLPRPLIKEDGAQCQSAGMRAPHVAATMKDISGLQAFQTSQQVTVATVFQLAWALMLSSYTGSNQVSWGGLFNGREVDLPDAHQIVGPMINQTIHYIPLKSEATVANTARDVQRRFLDAFEHQNSSLAAIQHALGHKDRTFFNTLMSYRRKSQNDKTKQGHHSLILEPVATIDPTEYDVSLQIVVHGEDEINVILQYAPSFMDAAAANKIIEHYLELIQLLVEHPSRQLRDVIKPSKSDIEFIQSWNKTLKLPPITAPDSVHELVQDRLRTNPEKVVVDAWDGTFTGEELDDASECLALHLRTVANISPNTPIGFCMSKSKWAIATILGILKSGGAVVPLGVQDPLARVETIRTNTNIKLVVADSYQCARLKRFLEDGVRILDVVQLLQGKCTPPRPSDNHKAPNAVSPSDMAFIMHTSGSTGIPKGVVINHDSLCASMKAFIGVPQVGFGPDDRVLQFTAFTFDPSNHEVLSTLYSGGCVCVPSEQDRLNNLDRFICDFQVTTATLTPSVARMVGPDQVPTLQSLSLLGEALRSSDIEEWIQRNKPGLNVVNIYGPTECAIIVSASPPLTDKRRAGEIGFPLDGIALWVVQPNNFNYLCPVGVLGELLVEGPFVGAGYLNDAEQTAASFIRDPLFVQHLGSHTSRRMYRTGDIARQNLDGSITYIGRRDNQVKVNGQRVEIAEIENTILRLGAGSVRRACVSLIPYQQQQGASEFTESSEKRLAAAVEVILQAANQVQGAKNYEQAKPAVQAYLDDLWLRLFEDLPHYMVPSILVPVKKIPLTSAGKLDRVAMQNSLSINFEECHNHERLRHNDRQDSVLENALMTPTEAQLQGLWANILQKPLRLIRKDDDFFRIGGDSIGAMKLVAAARRADPSISLTVATIFQHPRLSELATTVHSRHLSLSSSTVAIAQNSSTSTATNDSAPFSIHVGSSPLGSLGIASIASHCQLTPDHIQDVYPCTPLQEGMLAITAKRPDKYVLQRVFRLNIHFEQFKPIWEKLYQSLAILRTRIVPWETGAVQAVVQEAVNWRFSRSLEDYLHEDFNEPMTYGGQLCRICIVEEARHQGSSGCTHFVLTMHHSIYDGWSMIKMMDMLEVLARSGTVPAVVPMSRFIRHLADRNEEATEAFWRRHINSANVTKFPELPIDPSYLPQSTQHAMRYMIRPNGVDETYIGPVTISNILRAAWAILLNAYADTDTDEVLLMVAVSGRQTPMDGMLDVAGPTVATVPVRVQIPKGDRVPDFLSRVQQDAVEMIQYEHTGLQNIRRYVAGLEGLSAPAHLFTVQSAITAESAQYLESGWLPQDHKVLAEVQRGSKLEDAVQGYAFNIECTISSKSGVKVDIWFDESTINDSQIHRMLGQYENIFQQLCLHSNDNSCLIDQLSLVSPEDHAQILAWNKQIPKRTDRCIHEIVQDIAHRQPNAPAVCAWDGDFTYHELVCGASRLAHYIRQLDSEVGPDQLIGLCMSKSKWALVATLAILQAGAGVVPLGIGHPMARIQTIMDNTRARFILTDKEQAERLSRCGARTIIIDENLFASLPSYTGNTPCPEVTADNTSYVVFTSGSTGTPKGSILEHGALASSLLKHSVMLKLKSSSRALQFAAFTFDNSISDIFATLFQGGCVCEPSEDDRVSNLAKAVKNLRVNFLSLTPTVAALLRPEDIPPIEVLVVGGEPLDPNVIDIWGKSSDIINSYGPSECSILVACSRPLRERKDAPNVGLPVACCFWVVSPTDYNHLCPIGAPGELLLQGPQLGRGYINEPEKTAKAFVMNPRWVEIFPMARDQRLYRSGDLVRQNPDQSLTMLGRRDTQVKIHGQRVEVSEVESWIVRLMPDVRKAAVDYLALTHGRSDRVLVAALEMASNAAPSRVQPMQVSDVSPALSRSLGQLRTDLRGVVPSFMIPMIFVPVVRLPLNPSSKLDRLALRNALGTLTAEDWNRYIFSDASPKTVTTKTESTLRQLWASVLCLSEELIGQDDDLFDIGGDSVVAMRLSALSREAGMHLTVADILQNPVLKQMAFVVESSPINASMRYQPFLSLSEKETASVLDIASRCVWLSNSNGTIADAFATTDFQSVSVAGMLSDTRMDMNYISIDGNGPYDVERLRRACLALVRDVDVLRTAFLASEGDFWQVVLQSYEPEIREYKISKGGETMEAFTQSLIRQDIFGSPELGKPPFDVAIITSNQSNEHRLLFRISHALYDSHSLPILWDNLVSAYNSVIVNSPPSFSSFLFEFKSRSQEASLSYWTELLKNSVMPQIGSGVHSTAITSSSSSRLPQKAIELPKPRKFSLPSSLSSGMMAAAVVKAAWGLVLSEYSGLSDLTFGEVGTGRNALAPTVAGAYGCCVTVLPFRFRVPENETSEPRREREKDERMTSISELLNHLWKQQASSIQHDPISTKQIVQSSATTWNRFSSLINHQRLQESTLTLGSTDYSVAFVENVDGFYMMPDVSIAATQGNGTLNLTLAYAVDVVPIGVAELFQDSLCVAVDAILRAPNSSVSFVREAIRANFSLTEKRGR